MAASFENFLESGIVYSLDTLGDENFDEIALSLTVKEIEAILYFLTKLWPSSGLHWPYNWRPRLKMESDVHTTNIYLHKKWESCKWNILEVIVDLSWYLGQKGHPTLSSKASYDLENRAQRPKFCMLIEDIYMHYIYDLWNHLPFCIWEVGQNTAKTPNFDF